MMGRHQRDRPIYAAMQHNDVQFVPAVLGRAADGFSVLFYLADIC